MLLDGIAMRRHLPRRAGGRSSVTTIEGLAPGLAASAASF
jgi:hypothetical protein